MIGRTFFREREQVGEIQHGNVKKGDNEKAVGRKQFKKKEVEKADFGEDFFKLDEIDFGTRLDFGDPFDGGGKRNLKDVSRSFLEPPEGF